ncbi:hypothetical protein CEV34_3781 [Brucella pseudogrignonensis]|uniref:Uncharacterized protein n=1 Tax=Brucella pseudogrignonensis TaxID=419475 RepID=A0A256G7F1_9HYPH|nr:hypothetical protein CEV34_3781 [Brucella pseudogrignonensis]
MLRVDVVIENFPFGGSIPLHQVDPRFNPIVLMLESGL